MVIRKESEICIAILSNSSTIDILYPPSPRPSPPCIRLVNNNLLPSFAFNQKLPPSSSPFTAQNLAHSPFSSQIPCQPQRCRGMNNETLYLSAGNESFKCVTRGEDITVRSIQTPYFSKPSPNHFLCRIIYYIYMLWELNGGVGRY